MLTGQYVFLKVNLTVKVFTTVFTTLYSLTSFGPKTEGFFFLAFPVVTLHREFPSFHYQSDL